MRFTIVTAACLLAHGTLQAATPNCKTDTLEAYIDLGPQGCQVGGVVYANFAYTPGASAAAIMTANLVTVTPVFIPPATGRLTFSARWSAGKGQTMDPIISYTAALPAGASLPSSLQLALGTVHFAATTAAVSINENTNLRDSTGNPVTLNVFECSDLCVPKPSDLFDFNPTGISVLILSNHLMISGGNGTADLDSFSNSLDLCIVCD